MDHTQFPNVNTKIQDSNTRDVEMASAYYFHSNPENRTGGNREFKTSPYQRSINTNPFNNSEVNSKLNDLINMLFASFSKALQIEPNEP